MSVAEEVVLESKPIGTEPFTIEIIDVKYLGGYQLEITFRDGKRQYIDFGPFLRSAKNPDIRDYLDLEKFTSYRIEYGDLVWGDLDLCFPIIDLYEGHICHN